MLEQQHISVHNRSDVTAMPLSERKSSQATREALARENYDPKAVVAENNDILRHLSETRFGEIGQKIVKGEDLSFQESFLGMTFVVASTNKGLFRELESDFKKAHNLNYLSQNDLRGPAQTFLTAMAQKEVHGTLTPSEIAGMVASGMMDLTFRLGVRPHVLETGGMGGDKGFLVNGEKKKVINASTLSAIVLSSLDVPVMKHGSHGNTSAVGSTEAIDALGVSYHQSSFQEIARFFEKSHFYFSDAHIAKTLHDLSHSPFMRHETVNHIIGPMTPPIARDTLLHKVIGVNEGVHPEQVGKAYELLHDKGYQKVGNVIAVSGLTEDFNPNQDINDARTMRQYMMLDEMSPYHTLLGVVQNGRFKGTFLVQPEDFGLTIPPDEIQVVNTKEELLVANGQALQGLSGANTDYLALNAAIGLFTTKYLGRDDAIDGDRLHAGYLQESFRLCKEALLSGRASTHLNTIIAASKGAL